ncbi:YihY/virulence factor BrkB family protein [Aggregicoccus sp. 17bor-14]|uniref:YihY/virulence factor BrkB family protein n=1 Tax=Myxococcaceae TaxID=31 RepID=UPI00129C1BD0|nr:MULTISPECIES: YihY/virulence factor BrkB family protein [Myxococcaceae]MBF5045069.1 YihY/virulence factor BrkB family protein [Simulacricoccus sp. 17bor-14]MRI90811.1 YihY/virulence factor BrkB family protein [Aggregicoccus sp. 17bor-14]
MIVFVITVGLLVMPDSVFDQGLNLAKGAIPGDAGQLLAQQMARMKEAAHGGFAIGSALLALWSASRGSASLSVALNDLYDKEETRPWWKRQLVAVGTTLAVAALILLALGLLFAGPLVGHALADRFGLGTAFDVVWGLVRWVGAGALIMLVWALLYRWLPNTKAPLKVFTVGAFVGVLFWLAGSKLFALYASHFGSYEKTYGTLAGVIVFLTWLWLSNLSLLLGAEINDVLAHQRKEQSAAARDLDEGSAGKDDGEHKKPRPPYYIRRRRRPQPA